MTTPALNLELRPSRYFAVGLVGVHVCAVVAAWFNALPWFVALLLSCAIVVHGVWQWRRHWRPRWQRLCVDDSGWRLVGEGGDALVQPTGEAFVTTWLIVLPLRDEHGRQKSLVLWPDSTDKDGLRRLRVRLRMGR